MTERNRAQGWQHAKRSGHENEKLIAELTKQDVSIQKRLLECAHLSNVEIKEILYGGLSEKNVDCILGGNTKSKTDMWLILSNGQRLNVSIKKDESGQVFLIGIDRFINGFEKQYNITIDNDIKRALRLYFGSAPDINDILQNFGGKNASLELRKHRLVAETLKLYDENLYNKLLSWFNDNIGNIFDFCFSKGLARNQSDWADIIWYKNLVGKNSFDKMLYLPDVTENIPHNTIYGTRNGGSTIQLPFGFVQWHSPKNKIPGNLQFHHDYNKICKIQD